ncbi:MAG: hypothetical protein ACOX15_09390 [Tepidanaerobacteraceae bacterium]
MESIVVTSAVRTPIGKLGGGLKDVPPENLTKLVIKEAVNKSGVKKELIDEVIIGQTKQTTDAPNIARVKRTKKPFDPKRAVTNKLINTALDRGLMLYTAANCADGIKGDAVMIAPPLTVTKDEIDMILGLFEEVISDVFELEE